MNDLKIGRKGTKKPGYFILFALFEKTKKIFRAEELYNLYLYLCGYFKTIETKKAGYRFYANPLF